MAEAVLTPDAIAAENELAELLHDWAARWVVGHDPADRASCFAVDLSRLIVEGGESSHAELLVKSRRVRPVALVCSDCLRPWADGHRCEA